MGKGNKSPIIKTVGEIMDEYTGIANCQRFYRHDVEGIAEAYHAQFATEAGVKSNEVLMEEAKAHAHWAENMNTKANAYLEGVKFGLFSKTAPSNNSSSEMVENTYQKELVKLIKNEINRFRETCKRL